MHDAALPCLVLNHVSRVFGGLKAVDDVNLTLAVGERHALIGPNGAGKTTLFNLISGELPVSRGTITLFGVDVTGLAPHKRAARGMARTFQITRIFPELTVFENLLLASQVLNTQKFTMHRPIWTCADLVAKATKVMHEFGLTPLRQERTRNLSYGDQRKVEVALSMAGRPRLLLLDEPMAGLSTAESNSMQGLLKSLDPSTTVLLIEHDMDIAFGFAEKVTVLSQGRVLTAGHSRDVSANAAVQQIYLGVDPAT